MKAFKNGIYFALGILFIGGLSFALTELNTNPFNVDAVGEKEASSLVSFAEFNSIIKTIKGIYNDEGVNAEDPLDNYIGIGTTDPMSKLDVAGGIKPGDEYNTIECNTDKSGTMRYNSTSNGMEYCNGSDWVGMGGGEGCLAFTKADIDNGRVHVHTSSIGIGDTVLVDISGEAGYVLGGNIEGLKPSNVKVVVDGSVLSLPNMLYENESYDSHKDDQFFSVIPVIKYKNNIKITYTDSIIPSKITAGIVITKEADGSSCGGGGGTGGGGGVLDSGQEDVTTTRVSGNRIWTKNINYDFPVVLSFTGIYRAKAKSNNTNGFARSVIKVDGTQCSWNQNHRINALKDNDIGSSSTCIIALPAGPHTIDHRSRREGSWYDSSERVTWVITAAN